MLTPRQSAGNFRDKLRAILTRSARSARDALRSTARVEEDDVARTHSGALAGSALSLGLFMLAPMPAGATDAPPAAMPQFTAAQAEAGKTAYEKNCITCHGTNLEGGGGSPLAGPAFVRHWANGRHKLDDIYTQISTIMPATAPGSLTKEEYTNIVAYILSRNGFTSGSVPLTPSVLQVTLLAPGSESGGGNGSGMKAVPASFPVPPKTVEVSTTQGPSDEDLKKSDDSSWLMYNRDYRGDRYSDLAQITAANAGTLTTICAFQAGETGTFQAAPVIYDGLMYITTPFSTFALDAKTCTKVWDYTFLGETDSPVILSRGVAIYHGKVFRPTPDGHLLALDAKTGKLLWDTWETDPGRGYWLSAAPVTYNGMVFMGEGGADWGVNAHI